MIGKLVQIRDERLFFRVEFGPGQFGETPCAWTDLSPSSILELGDFYYLLKQKEPQPNNVDVARRAIALAVFAREYALSENKIHAYLNQASQTGADVKELYEKLFPPNPPH